MFPSCLSSHVCCVHLIALSSMFSSLTLSSVTLFSSPVDLLLPFPLYKCSSLHIHVLSPSYIFFSFFVQHIYIPVFPCLPPLPKTPRIMTHKKDKGRMTSLLGDSRRSQRLYFNFWSPFEYLMRLGHVRLKVSKGKTFGTPDLLFSLSPLRDL